MKIHHLSCGSMCPHGRKLLNGDGGLLERANLCCHCLLIETEQGLVLVDTGLGTRELDPENSHIPALNRRMLGVQLNLEDSALYQIRKLGFNEKDVTDILVTHLDFDHAGGLADFPNARVHIFYDEYEAAMNPASFMEKQRYMKRQWHHKPNWHIHKLSGEKWNDFEGVRAISSKETDILLVPTIGHTRGHCSIAVKQNNHWLLHCGDAYFHHGEMQAEPNCPAGSDFYQKFLAVNKSNMLNNKERLRQLALNAEANITLFCAHDPHELSQLRLRQSQAAAKGAVTAA